MTIRNNHLEVDPITETIKIPIWTLDDARHLIAELQTALRPLDMHVVLGGGVLNKGLSYNDLDLYILPVYKHRPYHWAAIEQVIYEHCGQHKDMLKNSEGLTGNGEPDNHLYLHQWVCMLYGKRIDVFIANPREV